MIWDSVKLVTWNFLLRGSCFGNDDVRRQGLVCVLVCLCLFVCVCVCLCVLGKGVSCVTRGGLFGRGV